MIFLQFYHLYVFRIAIEKHCIITAGHSNWFNDKGTKHSTTQSDMAYYFVEIKKKC